MAGAFDFAIEPGHDTVMHVRSVLFPRREIATIGIAPLTSMYFFGPERRAGIDDFRDAVHDSDGLRMVNGSRRAAVAAAAQSHRPRDLGLRRRQPPRLRPDPARPRASPLRGRRGALRAAPQRLGRAGRRWGQGSVMLVEIPSADEFTDNIVVFWRPVQPLVPGTRQRLQPTA